MDAQSRQIITQGSTIGARIGIALASVGRVPPSAPQIVVTGIKPTSRLHLGNYVGAIRPCLERARTTSAHSLLFIADYHALTARMDPIALRRYVYDVAATWIALGLDPERVSLFRQSDVPEIFEMAWILACVCPKGMMNRAHAYKAQIADHHLRGSKDVDAGINMGLFNYPILMAADILCLDADEVPVGPDQRQHVEIARELAKRINHNFGSHIIKIPAPYAESDTPVLPGTDGRKMSKSYDNAIALLGSPREIEEAVARIQTDSSPRHAPKHPDTSIIFQIYQQLATPQQSEQLRARYTEGIGWGEAKAALSVLIAETFSDARARHQQLHNNPDEIDRWFDAGSVHVRSLTRATLARVRRAIGIDI